MFFRKKIKIPVEVSARHCHLAKKDFEVLFGRDAQLEKIKQLSQPSDFACAQTVSIKINSNILENVRVIGPLRDQTQVEVSITDAIYLGANPPIKLSGDLAGSAPVVLVGPAGSVELKEGLIIAKRHIHCATDEARNLGLKNGQIVSVEIAGDRAIVFKNIPVRVKDNYKLSLQLDTDEGNAAGVSKTSEGILIK